jgi:hypothetical protein
MSLLFSEYWLNSISNAINLFKYQFGFRSHVQEWKRRAIQKEYINLPEIHMWKERSKGLGCDYSAGTIPGIDSGWFDSFDDFCGRARRLEQNVKESIQARHESQIKMGKQIELSKPKLAKKGTLKSEFSRMTKKQFEKFWQKLLHVFSPTPKQFLLNI